MDKEELHNIVEEQQPNICQIVCYKDNKKYILMFGIIIKKIMLSI